MLNVDCAFPQENVAPMSRETEREREGKRERRREGEKERKRERERRRRERLIRNHLILVLMSQHTVRAATASN